jgi:predicted PurR-regulated permease PerM
MNRFDLSAIFPPKDDPRHPPLWLWRALVWVVATVFIAMFIYGSVDKLSELISVVLISLFFAMALEPATNFFASKGLNKKVATLLCIFVALALIIAAVFLFGSIFVEQLVSLFGMIPEFYSNIQAQLFETFHITVPDAPDVAWSVLQQYSNEIGAQAISITSGTVMLVIDLLAMILIMYYMCGEGEKFRGAISSWLPPKKQEQFIQIWTITQTKIGGFLGSRLILAIISTIFVSIVCIIMGVPSWLPLGIFMGVIGQFVPTVGVYIGGALPVIVTMATKGPVDAVIMLVILIVYQNLENMLIMPKVSQEALDLNPATAFLSVLVFGYIWGPLGAFLALPVVATIITVLRLITTRYDVIDIEDIRKSQHKQLKQDKIDRESAIKTAKASLKDQRKQQKNINKADKESV